MSPEPCIVGWDLGGAHLKLALADRQGRPQRVIQRSTPLWQGLESLRSALRELRRELPLERARHVLTMTGELVDLFDNRVEGVGTLADLMARELGADLRIYAGALGFVPAGDAERHAERIASANWHATGQLVARHLESALLLDIGSTTTDLIAVCDGRLLCRGYSDRERLAREELVYTGVVRSPLMSLAERAPMAGEWLGLAAEHFATTADIYRIIGTLDEAADLSASADGGAKTRQASMRRLARMVGMDLADAGDGDWRGLADYLAECQLTRIQNAVFRQLSLGLPPRAPLVGAGVGRFLVRALAQRLRRPYVDLGALLQGAPDTSGLDAADCAPAVAVALLAATETGNEPTD